ncbi:Deoxyuridine 5'-triphosphate nucleotidohydrolase [Pseudomonas sp. OF001]|uniref:dUTP diphosphatase n=1 Tax=Pseudomonas sp. OF001 TaxID=2772300 RepID=UPI001917C60E|nr:dUTP diphosphatase [Pseudomonas sp. OF001]CAD5377380.1 Deoxyuridine 5'-triphosphate nucleotidohydrolase [Pseudomonas sp. OF001]
MELKVKKLHPEALLPRYGSEYAGCFDLHALLPETGGARLLPGDSLVVRTGLAFEIPASWSMDVFSRSGHGFKNGVRLANCVGIIDADYRGEVMVKLVNEGKAPLDILHGDRIAQAKLVPAPLVHFVEVEELGETARGEGGFGSTGVSA